MNIFEPKSNGMLEEEIQKVLTRLSELEPTDDKYQPLVSRLKELTEARERKSSMTVSPDVLISAAVNIIGLILIMNFEKTGIITSKAFSLIGRKV